MEDEDDWEEEQLVLVELSGLLEQEVLFKASTEHCRLLGIDTGEPVLQIGPYTFIGHYEDVIGTHVIFEETTSDDTSNEKKQYKYKGSVSKCLKMGRAFLRDKTAEENVLQDSDQSSSSGNSSSDDDANDDDGNDDKIDGAKKDDDDDNEMNIADEANNENNDHHYCGNDEQIVSNNSNERSIADDDHLSEQN